MLFEYIEPQPSDQVLKHIWQRNAGNLVIVVIDDELHYAAPDIEISISTRNEQLFLHRFRQEALKWPDTQAIGFFPLPSDIHVADEVLALIEKWLGEFVNLDSRLCFLVDIISETSGEPNILTAPHIKGMLVQKYDRAHIRYMTRGGAFDLDLTNDDFLKSEEYNHFENHGQLSPKLLSFFGKGKLHEDKRIDDAIHFYAKPWEAGLLDCTHPNSPGWCHNCLEDQNSEQVKALADWLKRADCSISPEDLIDGSSDGDGPESAKSLMIWKRNNDRNDLWDSPPWRSRDRRSVRGKVLNAVLSMLNIQLIDPIPSEESIIPPCVPCFPFFVSLRSFLWHLQDLNKRPVEKVCFFKLGEMPQVNIFRLVLQQEDKEAPYRLAKRLFGMWMPNGEDPGVSTRSLINLVHCRTDGLTGGKSGDYMSLFKEGTELPVVALETALSQINLIWSVK